MLRQEQGTNGQAAGTHSPSKESGGHHDRQDAAPRSQTELVSAAPPALSLQDPLSDDQLELIAFPGPVGLRSNFDATGFDPLAVIQAGRERDRRAVARDNSGEQLGLLESVDAVSDDLLCFMLQGEEYGVPLRDAREIIKPRDLTEVPRVPACIEGLISLRGLIVPVFNLRQRLLMPPNDARSQERLVIVQCGTGRCGLRVDRVTGVVSIPRLGRETAPAVLDEQTGQYIAGIGRQGDRMVILLDIEAVVRVTAREVAPA